METRSYQWRQTITFESCSHEDANMGAPATQQLSVDQIFVMFDADNDLIRFAMSNKIGSVHSESTQQMQVNSFPFGSCINDCWPVLLTDYSNKAKELQIKLLIDKTKMI